MQHELRALQPEHPVGLGPAAVVADHHADDAAERPPHLEALGTDLEVALLEVLEGAPRLVLVVPGQVHLAVATDLVAVAADEDLGVVAVTVRRLLGEAEAEADAEASGFVEEGLGLDRRHLGLEPHVEVGVVLEVPAREERRERELGIDDELGSERVRVVQQGEQPVDDIGPGVVALHRSHLCSSDGDGSTHDGAPSARSASASVNSTCSNTLAPASRSSGSVCSAGLWLMPSWLGVNTIAAGHTRAIIWASWPAPDGKRCTE